ncbi:hypothetical protein IW261DRAFT_912899 [Armillaria novae-zelandiae]|uniref:Uncharacterized protein n=1 Tax=Armillaria novae-zelandiae TaxID=153914 RepID=A0AA39NSK1_9AGAR|nr:hypothetical protein IW261DRAFT_912899 [Armillaria novae-zelandiae]
MSKSMVSSGMVLVTSAFPSCAMISRSIAVLMHSIKDQDPYLSPAISTEDWQEEDFCPPRCINVREVWCAHGFRGWYGLSGPFRCDTQRGTQKEAKGGLRCLPYHHEINEQLSSKLHAKSNLGRRGCDSPLKF